MSETTFFVKSRLMRVPTFSSVERTMSLYFTKESDKALFFPTFVFKKKDNECICTEPKISSIKKNVLANSLIVQVIEINTIRYI